MLSPRMVSLLEPFSLQSFLDRLAEIRGDDVFFIEIGAMDGVSFDPIYETARRFGWRGMLVEPCKDLFERLKSNYQHDNRLIFENVAISETREVRPLYRVPLSAVASGAVPDWAAGISSFYLDRNALGGLGLPEFHTQIKPFITVEQVECVPFQALVDKHEISHIDLIQIDTEGHDYHILKQIDLSRYRPLIVKFEACNLPNEELHSALEYLTGNGYKPYQDDLDVVAVSPELERLPGSSVSLAGLEDSSGADLALPASWDGTGTLVDNVLAGTIVLDGGYHEIENSFVWSKGNSVAIAFVRNPFRQAARGELRVEVMLEPAISVVCEIAVADGDWQPYGPANSVVIAAAALADKSPTIAIRIRAAGDFIPSRDVAGLTDPRALGAQVFAIGMHYDNADLLQEARPSDLSTPQLRDQAFRTLLGAATDFLDQMARLVSAGSSIQPGGALLERYRRLGNLLYHLAAFRRLGGSQLRILQRFYALAPGGGDLARQLYHVEAARQAAADVGARDVTAVCNTVILGGPPVFISDSLLLLTEHILPSRDHEIRQTSLAEADRNVWQFWDRNPPADVETLMTRWQGYDERYRRLDEPAAAAWLAARVDDAAVSQFRRCWHPAMKADLLRYHLLHRSGGLWVDADENAPARDNDIVRGLLALTSVANVLSIHWAGDVSAFPGSYVTTGIIGAPSGSAFVAAILSRVTGWLTNLPEDHIGTAEEIHRHTGPTVANAVLSEFMATGVVKVTRCAVLDFPLYVIETGRGRFCFISETLRARAFEGSTPQDAHSLSYKSDRRNWRFAATASP